MCNDTLSDLTFNTFNSMKLALTRFNPVSDKKTAIYGICFFYLHIS